MSDERWQPRNPKQRMWGTKFIAALYTAYALCFTPAVIFILSIVDYFLSGGSVLMAAFVFFIGLMSVLCIPAYLLYIAYRAWTDTLMDWDTPAWNELGTDSTPGWKAGFTLSFWAILGSLSVIVWLLLEQRYNILFFALLVVNIVLNTIAADVFRGDRPLIDILTWKNPSADRRD